MFSAESAIEKPRIRRRPAANSRSRHGPGRGESARRRPDHDRPSTVVRAANRIGNRDLGFERIERSFAHHGYWELFINVDPAYDWLHSEARFHRSPTRREMTADKTHPQLLCK